MVAGTQMTYVLAESQEVDEGAVPLSDAVGLCDPELNPSVVDAEALAIARLRCDSSFSASSSACWVGASGK